MSKNKKINIKKSIKFHWTHLVAVIVLGGYFLISKLNLVHALSRENSLMAFSQLFIFGGLFTFLFLYLFSHEKFFPFAKEIEDKEKKKEKTYLKKYIHHGKILGTFLIGLLCGPVFLSITARLLLNSYKYKYFIVFLTCLFSSIATFGFGRLFRLLN